MPTEAPDQTMRSIHLVKEIDINAPIEIAFEAILEELGPSGEMPGGEPFPMVFEPWPGGRWFRDLGNKAGHFWGHVQVIKPPKLIELCGPMFMSFPGVNHVQYRLTGEGNKTQLKLTHRAMGQIPTDVMENVGMGWDHGLQQIRKIADRLAAAKGGER